MNQQRKIQVKPSKKQYEALLSLIKDNGISFIGYGGAAGGGKTILAALWISMMCMKYPGVRYGVFRRYITDALDTTFRSFHKALMIIGLNEAPSYEDLQKKVGEYDYVIRNGGKEIVFSNGSEIWLRGLQDKPTDVHFTKVGGLELTGGYVDEANECPEAGIAVLKKRIGREKNKEYGIPRKLLCTFNPDKGWVSRQFWIPFKQGTELPDTRFIRALPTDNPYLTEEYLNELKNEKNEVLRQRLFFGNFDYDSTPGRLFEYDKLNDLWTNARTLGEIYVTIDVARFGKDKTVIKVWKGLHVCEVVTIAKSSIPDIEEEVKRLQVIYGFGMSNVIADEDGVGGGLVDALECRGFINNSSPLSPYNSKWRPDLKKNYQNLKTQCYFILADYINTNKISIEPDYFKNELIQELDVIVETTLDDRKKSIISKEDIKEKIGRSPDYSDALMMRMWFELRNEEGEADVAQGDHNVYVQKGNLILDNILPEELELDFNIVSEPSLNPYDENYTD